jgi:uncharacterized protein
MKHQPLDRWIVAQFLAALAFALAATSAVADARLKTATVRVGPHPLKVEVVSNDADRARGLMYRKALGRNEGMLFVFDEPAYHSMWMQNTLIPLSVAFIDAQGTILNILDMEPQTLDAHVSAGPSIYAIEVNKGWFAAKKVKAGDKVTGLPKK